MTGESDDGVRSEERMDVEASDESGKTDAVDLAAGVTCESYSRSQHSSN